MMLDPCVVSLSEEVEKLSGMVRPSAAMRGVAFSLYFVIYTLRRSD